MKNLAAAEDEAQLVAAAQSGRDGAFTELVRLHQPYQLRVAMRLVRNREDAEDVVQKALLAAWRNIPSFRGEAGFRTWLTRITWNFGAMVLRHRKSLRLADDPPKPLDVFPDTSSIFNAPLNPEQSAIVADFSSSVRTLVVNLPHNRRDPLYMWIFEEKNVGEIARELDLPMPTVKSRLRRARQELGGRLRAMGHGGECRSEVR